MAENIDKKKAEKVILSAFRQRCTQYDEISANIKLVLEAHHKTYKYILVNGILAKATNPKVNPLALQAGASLKGAFDARSLCHQVLVPFEQDFLHKALGGSNEPFLNKPARFTHLSKDNPVRKGKDKVILELLIKILSSIKTSKSAKAYLACALGYLGENIAKNKALNDSALQYNPTLIEVYEFIIKFLEQSHEGESAAIIVGTLEKMYHNQYSNRFKVIAHKVNQSGASSKEIGDIDIYKDNKFHYAIEVKDKRFNSYDLKHAFDKILQAGGKKGKFVYGLNAAYSYKEIKASVMSFEQKGFFVLFNDIKAYSKTMLFKIELENKQVFVQTLIQTSDEINSKQNTKIWIQYLLQELNWK
ncbi:MAG: restriction endonuclease, SacI family [Aureispira sp.]